MSTEFKTDACKGEGYKIIFTTDDVANYRYVQNACRNSIDNLFCVNVSLKPDMFICSKCKAHYDIARLDIPVDEDNGIPNYCPNCGAEVV